MNNEIIYLYGAVSLILVLLLYIAFNVFRTKRMIKKQIQAENETSNY